MSQQNAKSKLLPGHRWLERKKGDVIQKGDMLYCADGEVRSSADLGRKVGTSFGGPQWDHHRYSRPIEQPKPPAKTALEHLREAMNEARRKQAYWGAAGWLECAESLEQAYKDCYLDLRRRVRECEKGGGK